MPFSTSSTRTSRPNSFGLWALPLRITWLWGSNKLTILPATCRLPRKTRCWVCWITFSTRGRKCCKRAVCHSHGQQTADYRQLAFMPALHHLTRLAHHPPCQGHQLLVAFLHPPLVYRSQALGSTADLQQTILDGAGMIDHLHGSALALAGNVRQAAAEHADAVAQQTAVGWIVNVGLNTRGIRF